MVHSFLIALCTVLAIFVFGASLYVTVFAFFGLRRQAHWATGNGNTKFLVLVPAHNEGADVLPTIHSIQAAQYPGGQIRIVVIADNCTDNTSEQAGSSGVEVWVRNDPEHRGKGQALAWALRRAGLTFDMAAIIDADTEVDPQFFSAMDAAYTTSLREGSAETVFQGRYLFARTSEETSWLEDFTIASKAAENSFSYRPRTLLGLASLIQGNGFCISRDTLSRVPFAATSIVEDAEYAVTLALHGIPVQYSDDAVVVSRIARSLQDAAPQRLRWASGTFALLFDSIPRLLRESFRQQSMLLMEMAVMLLFTSRLLIVYITAIDLVLLALTGFVRVPAALLATALFLQIVYLWLVFRKSDKEPVPLQAIVCMPLYVGFLGVVQIGALLGLKKGQWNRTTR